MIAHSPSSEACSLPCASTAVPVGMQTRSDAQGNEGEHTPVLVPLPPAALPHIGVTHMPVTSEQASLLGQSPPEQAVAIEGTTLSANVT